MLGIGRTGYKQANSESNLRELGAMTSYKQFYEKGVEIPYMQKSNISVNYKQKLHKYDPNALCNRLPVKFDNEVRRGKVCMERVCNPQLSTSRSPSSGIVLQETSRNMSWGQSSMR